MLSTAFTKTRGFEYLGGGFAIVSSFGIQHAAFSTSFGSTIIEGQACQITETFIHSRNDSSSII
jgi:hypothetical protein